MPQRLCRIRFNDSGVALVEKRLLQMLAFASTKISSPDLLLARPSRTGPRRGQNALSRRTGRESTPSRRRASMSRYSRNFVEHTGDTQRMLSSGVRSSKHCLQFTVYYWLVLVDCNLEPSLASRNRKVIHCSLARCILLVAGLSILQLFVATTLD